MSWSQPVCRRCWELFNPGRIPVRLVNPTEETCCVCGEKTNSGIYVRADPKTVPHPKEKP